MKGQRKPTGQKWEKQTNFLVLFRCVLVLLCLFMCCVCFVCCVCCLVVVRLALSSYFLMPFFCCVCFLGLSEHRPRTNVTRTFLEVLDCSEFKPHRGFKKRLTFLIKLRFHFFGILTVFMLCCVFLLCVCCSFVFKNLPFFQFAVEAID